ncbi:MAG: hypothetical protein MUO63_15805 [Desulfobulbaceae bacterium]|nr:hypothetical protein [Desulfobulbaceae bacterium]
MPSKEPLTKRFAEPKVQPESPFLDEAIFADMDAQSTEEWRSRTNGYMLESPFQHAFELEREEMIEPEIEESAEFDEELYDGEEEIDEYEVENKLYHQELDEEFVEEEKRAGADDFPEEEDEAYDKGAPADLEDSLKEVYDEDEVQYVEGETGEEKVVFRFNCTPGSESRRAVLYKIIVTATKLANDAVFKLETKKDVATRNKFFAIFGQDPSSYWPVPWMPRKKMRAGDIVASRFRTNLKWLQKGNTLYMCSPCNVGGSPVQEENPTETIVQDVSAWAVLCQNRVELCPKFWKLRWEWQVGTILHEMFHLRFGLNCAWFQHDSKERKMNNAYCYEAFALVLANLPVEDITKDKCKASPI